MKANHATPLVSIGMPVFNGERFIRQAVDSLLAQDHEHLELIISDNGSEDATAAICRQYAAKDPRVQFHRSPSNVGATANFNRVFELSSGDYFMWAAHDDFWAPEFVRTCLELLLERDSILLAGCACELVDPETGEHIETDRGISTRGMTPYERFKLHKLTLHTLSNYNIVFYGLFRRASLDKVMPFRKVISNDHLLLAQLAMWGEFDTHPESLMTKRRGGASRSYRANANALCISNPLLLASPMLVREFYLQRLIYGTDKLTSAEKLQLSIWSAINYLRVHIMRASRYHGGRTLRRNARRVRDLGRRLLRHEPMA